MKATVERIFVGVAAALICAGAVSAAELHPVVEVQSGYLFGAISDGKWIKAEEAANSLTDGTTYRVYGLTQALGEAKGSAPKSVDEALSRHNGGHTVTKTGGRCDCSGCVVECIAAKATNRRHNSASLHGCCARFLENEGNRATESEDRQHPSCRFRW